ncbi:LOW QUALITY PROTEIN: uncharacterized protein [Polyergus mexicanus]|uniref:LOW QUALITY PROTEIN: uncharacterized protein n=1 Tax=Polyergus mexicanus TaxID=615972 RepID=UPI0038B43503
MGEELENQRYLEMESGELLPELQLFTLKPGMDRRRYNAQRTNEVAAVFYTNADGEIPESYVTICNKNTKTLQKVSIMDPNVEPWIYPLFYSYGRRLFQQWLVDSYVKIEKDRIDYCKDHQKELRIETYQGLRDYIQTMADNLNGRIGKMVILPSMFTGSPRNMLQNYQDAMAIIVDKYISAEIPDPSENRILYNIVMRHMIHGPCGDWCLVNGQCSKHYPKSYLEETRMDEDAYLYYRRRNNGHDVAAITIEPITENVIIDHDEIHNYIEARYVGPVEASWRILGKKLQDKSHTACLALGLIEDDDEWKQAMNEAVGWMMPRQLRRLFVRILLYCQPLHPEELWESFKLVMSEDYIRHFGILQGQEKGYMQINSMLCAEGKSFADFPQMKQLTESNEKNDYMTLEQDMEIGTKQYKQLNDKQKEIVDLVLSKLDNNTNNNNCFYIDGPSGSATLLPTGKTIFIFGMKRQWLLGGDFRQLLPIKIRGTRSEVVNLSIKFSSFEILYFINYSLKQNMRVLPEEIEFAKFLLDMGDRLLNDSNDNIQIPECCIAPINVDIVEDIYGDLIRKKEFNKIAKCAILSARNINVDEINKKVVELLDVTNERIYTSIDSTVNCGDNGDIGEALLPEYLNSLSPSSLPPYELQLRPNCIIMLIRNLSINEGLCNEEGHLAKYCKNTESNLQNSYHTNANKEQTTNDTSVSNHLQETNNLLIPKESDSLSTTGHKRPLSSVVSTSSNQSDSNNLNTQNDMNGRVWKTGKKTKRQQITSKMDIEKQL